jgi:hypothetical protein
MLGNSGKDALKLFFFQNQSRNFMDKGYMQSTHVHVDIDMCQETEEQRLLA